MLMAASEDGPVGAWVGSIDLLYRCRSSGEVVIADHKTDRVGDRDPNDVARHHASQGRVYVEAVQKAMGLESPPRFEIWLIETDQRITVAL